MNISFKTWRENGQTSVVFERMIHRYLSIQLRNLIIAVISLISLIVYETPLIVHLMCFECDSMKFKVGLEFNVNQHI